MAAKSIIEPFKTEEKRRMVEQRLSRWKSRRPIGWLITAITLLIGSLVAMGCWWPPQFWNLVAVVIFGGAVLSLLIFFVVRCLIMRRLKHRIQGLS